ncbi:MAG: hypothetical protein QXU73_00755 [Thermoplasmata archaeon]
MITPRRTDKSDFKVPHMETFLRGCREFEEHEKRDAMYKVASFLMQYSWKKDIPMMADGLGVLLLTWNQAFYRYGLPDFQRLEDCIRSNLPKLEVYRRRSILSFSQTDHDEIISLFREFLDALQIAEGNSKGKKSPVAVGKALHLLAPDFFPAWDTEIQRGYHCYYNQDPAERYVRFCAIVRNIASELEAAERVKDCMSRTGKTLVKLIDEFNYSKYTQKWI